MLLGLADKKQDFDDAMFSAMLPMMGTFLGVGLVMRARGSSQIATASTAGAAALIAYLLTKPKKKLVV